MRSARSFLSDGCAYAAYFDAVFVRISDGVRDAAFVLYDFQFDVLLFVDRPDTVDRGASDVYRY